MILDAKEENDPWKKNELDFIKMKNFCPAKETKQN